MSADPSGLYYADPTNPQSLNLYSYARNNPLIGTDPTGMAYCQWDDGSHDDSANTGMSGAVNSGSECTGAGGTWSHDYGLFDDGSQMGSEPRTSFTVTASLYTATDRTTVSIGICSSPAQLVSSTTALWVDPSAGVPTRIKCWPPEARLLLPCRGICKRLLQMQEKSGQVCLVRPTDSRY